MRFKCRRNSFFLSLIILAFALTPLFLSGQGSTNKNHPLYANLPVGKYAVGFKIVTLIDRSRVDKPEFNYLGELNKGDRSRKITLHIWYPAFNSTTTQKIRFEEYCYNELYKSTSEGISAEQRTSELNGSRNAIERWFGKTTDEAWSTLFRTPMLAIKDAVPVQEKFPVLIGTLRPLSTSITNELLASNGYIVVMVADAAFSSFADAALSLIPDMQFALQDLKINQSIDRSKVGVFGFSGSGFIPVLFGMHDYRVKAMADIESGIYMEGLYQGLSASNYYKPSKLRIPFLHIFSRDLSKQEIHFDQFENKSKFSKRYRLLLNQPALHHWDFATEGYVSCVSLNIRGAEQENIARSFEIASHYLLHFFNAELKGDAKSKEFLSNKPSIPQTSSALWDFTIYDPVRPAPDKEEFEYIIKVKGAESAITAARNTIKDDSTTNLLQNFVLNRIGYDLLNNNKHKDAIAVFKFNTELHPTDANLFDSLAEGYEKAGEIGSMKNASQKVIDLLTEKTTLTDQEKALKTTAEKRLH